MLHGISESIWLAIIHSEYGIFSAFTTVSKLVGQLPQGEDRQTQTYTEDNTLESEAGIPETLERWNWVFNVVG